MPILNFLPLLLWMLLFPFVIRRNNINEVTAGTAYIGGVMLWLVVAAVLTWSKLSN